MEISIVLGLASGALTLAAYATYIVDILRGGTKPEQWSFFVWFVLSIVFFASLLVEDIGWAIAYPAAGLFGAGVVWYLSLSRGYKTFDRLHVYALSLAGLALFGWFITSEPVVAILLAMVADFSGFVLTWKKTAKVPDTESLRSWSLGVAAACFALLAVPSASVELVIFPVYYLLVNASIVLLVRSSRLQRFFGASNAKPAISR